MRGSAMYQRVILGGIIFLGVFLFMVYGKGAVVELFLWHASEPFVRVGKSIVDTTRDVFAVFGSAAKLTERIETLEREKQALQSALGRLQSIEHDYNALRTECGLPHAAVLADYQKVEADVIGYNAGKAREWIMINRGRADDVEEGMAVVTREAVLVGTVSRVGAHVARVRLVTNAESVIRGETSTLHVKGIVRGVSHHGARFTMVERSQPLTDGDMVLTTRNVHIPGRLLIGTVYNIHVTEDGLYKEATLIPAYEARLQNHVSVILIKQEL